jgi:succinyl-diaminopimelate desuccinylase
MTQTPLTHEEVAGASALAEAQRERLVEMCAALVEARSDQPVGDTTGPARVIAAYLAENGLAAETRAAVPEKPNVLCRFGESGPHLVLNGHLDTLAPGDEAAWSVPPFRLGRGGGRLTGLGIGNMKAGTAVLAVAFVLLARDANLRGRVTFTAVADEVVFGPHGTRWLLEHDPDLRGDAVINAEGPGEMGVALAEKGLMWVALTAESPPGQGMLTTERSSAMARLARALAEIDGWNAWRAEAPAAIAAVEAHAGEHGLRLSANIGRIGGGDFVSQVATRVEAEIDFRIPPGLTMADVSGRLDALVAAAPGLSWRLIKGWDPNWSSPESPPVAAVLQACRAVRGEARPVVRLPASDASRWRALGVPAVCFGPQPTLAAGVDDYVNEQDVVDCLAVTLLAARSLLGRKAEEEVT